MRVQNARQVKRSPASPATLPPFFFLAPQWLSASREWKVPHSHCLPTCVLLLPITRLPLPSLADSASPTPSASPSASELTSPSPSPSVLWLRGGERYALGLWQEEPAPYH
jgi:hypothetical protein